MEENLIQINGGITINTDGSVKKRHIYEIDYIWNPATRSCEVLLMIQRLCTMKLQSHTTKKQTFISIKKATCKTENLYVSLIFSLITIALLIVISIYCYLIKYRAKQKY